MAVKRQIRLACQSFWDFHLYEPLEQLFIKAYDRRVRLRYIKIWFWDFSSASAQLSLFHEPDPDDKKNARVIRTLDRIRAKHGEGAIRYGKAA